MPVTMNGFSNPAFRREHNNAPEGHNQTTSIAGGRDFLQMVGFALKKAIKKSFLSMPIRHLNMGHGKKT